MLATTLRSKKFLYRLYSFKLRSRVVCSLLLLLPPFGLLSLSTSLWKSNLRVKVPFYTSSPVVVTVGSAAPTSTRYRTLNLFLCQLLYLPFIPRKLNHSHTAVLLLAYLLNELVRFCQSFERLARLYPDSGLFKWRILLTRLDSKHFLTNSVMKVVSLSMLTHLSDVRA